MPTFRCEINLNCWFTWSLPLLQHLTNCEEIPEYLLTVSWWSHAVMFLFSSAGARTHAAACAFLHPPVERSKRQAPSLCCCPLMTTLIACSRQTEVRLLTLNAGVSVFGKKPRQPYLPQAWKNRHPGGFLLSFLLLFLFILQHLKLEFWAWNFSC